MTKLKLWNLTRLEAFLRIASEDAHVNLARATILRAVYDVIGRDMHLHGSSVGVARARQAAIDWLTGDDDEPRLDEVCTLAEISTDNVKEAINAWIKSCKPNTTYDQPTRGASQIAPRRDRRGHERQVSARSGSARGEPVRAIGT